MSHHIHTLREPLRFTPTASSSCELAARPAAAFARPATFSIQSESLSQHLIQDIDCSFLYFWLVYCKPFQCSQLCLRPGRSGKGALSPLCSHRFFPSADPPSRRPGNAAENLCKISESFLSGKIFLRFFGIYFWFHWVFNVFFDFLRLRGCPFFVLRLQKYNFSLFHARKIGSFF